MELQELLKPANLDLNKTLVLRHVPMEPNIRRILPWLVAERPALFNAYQQIQNPKVENQMRKAEHVVSFFGHESSRAVYLGLYRIRGAMEPKDIIGLENSWNDRLHTREFGLNGN